MEENKIWANSMPLANLATGLMILSLWSLLFGVASPVAIIGALPWIGVAFPILLIAIIICFKNGDIMGGTVNAVLTGIALFQNGFKGIIVLIFTVAGVPMPEALSAGMSLIDGGANTAATVILFCVFVILIKAGDKIFAFFVAVATVGFFSLAVTALGLVDLEMVAAVCLTTFGCWLIYSGCAMLMENVLGKKIIPY